MLAPYFRDVLFSVTQLEALRNRLPACMQIIHRKQPHQLIAYLNDEQHAIDIIATINSAFLLVIFDSAVSGYRGVYLLNKLKQHTKWKDIVTYYYDLLHPIKKELKEIKEMGSAFDRHTLKRDDTLLYRLFFPEGVDLLKRDDWKEEIGALREKRKVTITTLNTHPITNPAQELLFTSNMLITIPDNREQITRYSSSLQRQLQQAMDEKQQYWYDHPIPIGISESENEILYGLQGLNDMVAFEKERGSVSADQRLNVVLSASTTHQGLRSIIQQYLMEDCVRPQSFEHLTIWALTENNCHALLEHVLIPIAKKMKKSKKQIACLKHVFGVDGEYGRHYSFLKAIAAFWHVFIDNNIRGTFKIDLDQVFPQKELVAETGQSALEHFLSPLWGASGVDYWGNEVTLSMIAGALVNESDIRNGLFTADVVYEQHDFNALPAPQKIFNSKLPQAVSTIAEMHNRPDLSTNPHAVAAQRVHVTGGTNGILIDALRRYRPFTPTFCGRAEDQAYLLSVFCSPKPLLRYLHQPGLIMRHDKAAFVGPAIKKAAESTMVGDYVRTLFFSNYVNSLVWKREEIKRQIDPFTGAFVSRIPITVAHLRYALEIDRLIHEQAHTSAQNLLQNALFRLPVAREQLQPAKIRRAVIQERLGWKCFYDILDHAESALQSNNRAYLPLQKKAREILLTCLVEFAAEE